MKKFTFILPLVFFCGFSYSNTYIGIKFGMSDSINKISKYKFLDGKINTYSIQLLKIINNKDNFDLEMGYLYSDRVREPPVLGIFKEVYSYYKIFYLNASFLYRLCIIGTKENLFLFAGGGIGLFNSGISRIFVFTDGHSHEARNTNILVGPNLLLKASFTSQKLPIECNLEAKVFTVFSSNLISVSQLNFGISYKIN